MITAQEYVKILDALDRQIEHERRQEGRRVISEQDSRIFRCTHHDFFCLTQTETSGLLDTPVSTVSDALARVYKVAPQLFPILTGFEADCVGFYWIDGMKTKEIAIYLDISKNAVYNAFKRAKDKGLYWPSSRKYRSNFCRYTSEAFDHLVIQKF